MVEEGPLGGVYIAHDVAPSFFMLQAESLQHGAVIQVHLSVLQNWKVQMNSLPAFLFKDGGWIGSARKHS